MNAFAARALVLLSVHLSAVAFADDNSIFFKVEKNGVVSYAIGTFHSGLLDINDLDPRILQALHDSETLLVERGGDSLRPESMEEQSYAPISIGRPLSKRISPGGSKKLKKFLDSIEALEPDGRDVFERLLAGSAGIGALAHYVFEAEHLWLKQAEKILFPLPSPARPELDHQIANVARSLGKSVISLDLEDTAVLSFQKNFSMQGLNAALMKLEPLPDLRSPIEFEDLSSTYQKIVRQSQEHHLLEPSMLVSYLANDVEAVLRSTKPAIFGICDKEELISVMRRDALWFDFISEQMNKRPTFMAVGLAHLYRYDSIVGQGKTLIDRLRDEGFTVTPMPLANKLPEGRPGHGRPGSGCEVLLLGRRTRPPVPGPVAPSVRETWTIGRD